MRPLKVFVNTPAFHVSARKNTDWQYTHLLRQMPNFAERLEVYYPHSALYSAQCNFRHLLCSLGSRSRKATMQSAIRKLRLEAPLPRRELVDSNCDLVFSYGVSPTNAEKLPVVLHLGYTDTVELMRRKIPESVIQEEREIKRRLIRRSAMVTVNTRFAMENLLKEEDDFFWKIRVVPFFLPHLSCLSEEQVRIKFNSPGKIQLAFIGREAKRKGLPEVFRAFEELNSKMPDRLNLVVVSDFSDGPISIPNLPNITHFLTKSREEVQKLLRQSHFLLMPSRFEGYGWVYLEAMAAGAIALACDNPIQREILAEGKCGLLVSASESDIKAKMLPYLERQDKRFEMAKSALLFCAANYLPSTVTNLMLDVFSEALSGNKSRSVSKRR